jgi:anoctamin-10
VQYLSGAAIVSNCFLLLLMFDKDGEWRMDPGLVGVLVLEHALLAARFGLSWFVPEVK